MPIGLFDLISLLYLLQTFRVVAQLIRGWRGFWDDQVTPADHRLAGQLAFFVLIPLGVFAHEAGHAAATWQVGGQVVAFQWRVFWGYIIPAGNFTPLEDWWISLSGNLVSIALGLLPVLLLLAARGIWAEILYAFARAQLIYALLWYPAMGVLGFGDWLTIYDFAHHTPYAQAMLVVHLGLIAGLWLLDRSPWAVRLRLASRPAHLQMWQKLEAAADAQPGSPEPLLQLARFFNAMDEQAASRKYLDRAARLAPDSAGLLAARAELEFARKRYPPAGRAATAALARGLPIEAQSQMHSILAFINMQGGQRPEALEHFDAALRLTPEADTLNAQAPNARAHELYYWRAIVKRSMARTAEARADFEQALRLAPDEASRSRARRELDAA